MGELYIRAYISAINDSNQTVKKKKECVQVLGIEL